MVNDDDDSTLSWIAVKPKYSCNSTIGYTENWKKTKVLLIAIASRSDVSFRSSGRRLSDNERRCSLYPEYDDSDNIETHG